MLAAVNSPLLALCLSQLLPTVSFYQKNSVLFLQSLPGQPPGGSGWMRPVRASGFHLAHSSPSALSDVIPGAVCLLPSGGNQTESKEQVGDRMISCPKSRHQRQACPRVWSYFHLKSALYISKKKKKGGGEGVHFLQQFKLGS